MKGASKLQKYICLIMMEIHLLGMLDIKVMAHEFACMRYGPHMSLSIGTGHRTNGGRDLKIGRRAGIRS